jgi:hypothetical protein
MYNRKVTQSQYSYGYSAIIGGILWVLYYVFDFAYGILEDHTSYQVANSPALRITGPAYFGGVVLIGYALLGVYQLLNLKYKALSIPGLIIGGIGTLAAFVGIISAILSLCKVDFPQQVFNFIGPSILPVFVSAILLGIASSKARTLPVNTAYLILVFGLTTLPLGLTIWKLMDNTVPNYWYDELHFVLAGIYWIKVGKVLQHPIKPKLNTAIV